MENHTHGAEPVWAVTRQKIETAVQRIVATAHPEQVILFGSHNKGSHRPDSDVDLLVVEEKVTDRYREIVRLHRSLRGLMFPADILVIDRKEFDESRLVPGSVYHAAFKEGSVLYERTTNPQSGFIGGIARIARAYPAR